MRFRRPGSEQQNLFDQLEHAKDLAQQAMPLDKLNEFVDFERFRDVLLETLGYKDRKDRGGNAPFDPVFMFKIIVLQKYYALSEEQTEFQIRDRFSFMRFLDLSPGDEVPDKNTIWDFKEALGTDGVAALFSLLDAQLHAQGVHGKEGAIVDASFVNVPRQRNSREDNASIKQGETPAGWEDKPRKLCQKDLDARWTKKNNETHYGYKNHVKSDAKSKLIRGKKIKARLCQKGVRGKPLIAAQKRANRAKSKVRARGEHIFGCQSWQMKADRIRTIRIVRAAREIGLGNLVYNLVRLVQLNVRMT